MKNKAKTLFGGFQKLGVHHHWQWSTFKQDRNTQKGRVHPHLCPRAKNEKKKQIQERRTRNANRIVKMMEESEQKEEVEKDQPPEENTSK